MSASSGRWPRSPARRTRYAHERAGKAIEAAPGHSLGALGDEIGERLEVEVEGRHTALGDAMATAGIFARMLDPLEARGIRTLGQALEASEGPVEIRRRQAEF